MAYLSINDFKAGLDARKYKLALPAGSLIELNNAHITPGGEIEKRKAFGRLVNGNSGISTSLPTGTFGMQPLAASILVFGSVEADSRLTATRARSSNVATVTTGAAHGFSVGEIVTIGGLSGTGYNGTSVTLLSGTTGSTLKFASTGDDESSTPDTGGFVVYQPASPFEFQRVRHPAVLAGETYSAGSHALAGVVCSETFAGKAWVAARFADGQVFGYYDGALIYDFTDGLVAGYMDTTEKLAKFLTDMVNLTETYTAVQGLAGLANTVKIYSLPGNKNSNALTKTTVAGTLTGLKVADTIAPTAAASAQASFAVIAGSVAAENYIAAVQLLGAATGTLASNGNLPSAGETVTIGAITYTWRSTFTVPAVAYEVKISSVNAAECLKNLAAAINLSGTAGTEYSTGTAKHPTVTATGLTETQFTVRALEPGTAGNSIGTTETSGTLSFGQATLAGGVVINLNEEASAKLVSTGTLPTDGHQVAVGGVTYRFKSTLAAAYDVKLAATVEATLASLAAAINLTGTAGTDYHAATAQHPTVMAGTLTATTVTVLARTPGPAGNQIAVSIPSGTTLSWKTLTGNAAATLTNGTGINFDTDKNTTAAAAALAITNYKGTSGFTAKQVANTVIITAVEASDTPNEYVVKLTASGNVCLGECAFSLSATAGQTPTGSITSVTVNGTAITTAAIAYNTSVQNTCALLVANINANTGVSGFLAFASGNSVWIARKITRSDDQDATVTVNLSTGTLNISNLLDGGLTVVLSENNALVEHTTDANGTLIGSPLVWAIVTGGVGPYTYTWNNLDAVGALWARQLDRVAQNGQKYYVACTKNYAEFAYMSGGYFPAGTTFPKLCRFTLTVSDAAGNRVTSETINVTVSS